MADTAADPGATGARAPSRRLLSRIPLWLRVSGFVAFILGGVLVGTMLLGASGAGKDQGGGHAGSGGQMQQMPHQGGSGSTHSSGGSHDARGDHSSGGNR
jgi:hypothetical protein